MRRRKNSTRSSVPYGGVFITWLPQVSPLSNFLNLQCSSFQSTHSQTQFLSRSSTQLIRITSKQFWTISEHFQTSAQFEATMNTLIIRSWVFCAIWLNDFQRLADIFQNFKSTFYFPWWTSFSEAITDGKPVEQRKLITTLRRTWGIWWFISRRRRPISSRILRP